jgi:hypothetical protein
MRLNRIRENVGAACIARWWRGRSHVTIQIGIGISPRFGRQTKQRYVQHVRLVGEAVQPGLRFNPVEFDGSKTRIVELQTPRNSTVLQLRNQFRMTWSG